MYVIKPTPTQELHPFTAIKSCDQKPCVGTNNCIDVQLPPYFFCIQCPSGKTGIKCDVGKQN